MVFRFLKNAGDDTPLVGHAHALARALLFERFDWLVHAAAPFWPLRTGLAKIARHDNGGGLAAIGPLVGYQRQPASGEGDPLARPFGLAEFPT